MDINLSTIIEFYIQQLKSNTQLSLEQKNQYQDYLSRYAEAVLHDLKNKSK